jgi:hypothetical protein
MANVTVARIGQGASAMMEGDKRDIAIRLAGADFSHSAPFSYQSMF